MAASGQAQARLGFASGGEPGLPARIVLTGFMGAGKTTVGRLLAGALGWRFADLDEAIETAEGATIAQLFLDRGESRFRQLEHEALAQLAAQEHLVLALGGGAIEDPRSRGLLLADAGTRLVHLEASLETVLWRCQGTDAVRPVLADRGNLEARYLRRLPLYREAHLTVAVDSIAPEEAVEAILTALRSEASS